MGRSDRMPLRDVRDVFYLLGEITELGTDPHVWREHMLRRLCAMTGARVGLTVDLCDALPGRVPRPIDPIDIGFAGRQRDVYVDYCNSGQPGEDPSMLAIIAHHQRRRLLTARREQLVDDRAWYASPVTSEARRASDVDDLLVASALLPKPGWVIGFSLYRDWNERGFEERDRKVVRLFFTELQKKLRVNDCEAGAPPHPLPPHLRQTLRLLLRGASAKEMAQALDLSPHTVNSYTKELYQRLHVGSRGELIAHFASQPDGRPVFLPREFDGVVSFP
jgi:hypothetical protein